MMNSYNGGVGSSIDKLRSDIHINRAELIDREKRN